MEIFEKNSEKCYKHQQYLKSFWDAVLCEVEAAEGGAGWITEARRILEAATLEAGYIILRLDPLENGGDADALDDNEEVPWVLVELADKLVQILRDVISKSR